MIEPRNSTKRYMDFVGPRRASATDPLISRPIARKSSATKTPAHKSKALSSANPKDPLAQKSLTKNSKTSEALFPSTATPRSRLSRAPIRPVSSSRQLAQPAPAKSISVKKTEEKALVSRKPSTAAKEYYPTANKTAKALAKTDKKANSLANPASGTSALAAAQNAKPSLSDELLDDTFSDFVSDTRIKATDRPHDDLAKKAAGALSGSSPFLANYNIDKRPLSNSVPDKKSKEPFEKVSYLGVNDAPVSSSRRNKISETEAEDELIDQKERKPVKIIDEDKPSAFPLVIIIILTIILGAAAGAGVYFLVAK